MTIIFCASPRDGQRSNSVEDYQDWSLLEMRELEREQITALATGADMPSPTPQPNADPLGYV
jgi:hypothetical protein